MPRTNQQIHLVSRPRRRGQRQQLRARRGGRRRARRGPGAGAPSLPQPRSLHARAHERRQELRPAAAAGPGDAGWHRRGGRGIEERALQGRRPGGRLRRVAAVQHRRRRRAGLAAQGRHHARTALGLPGGGRHARRHRVVRPAQDLPAQGGLYDRGQRRQRCRGQRRGPARQEPWLPRRGLRRRPGQVRLRDRGARLRRLRRLPRPRRAGGALRGAEGSDAPKASTAASRTWAGPASTPRWRA